MDKIQCSNCKCWRPGESYIGKKGTIVKRCLKCREKDARQKQRPEVKEKRNERNKERNYSQISREKRRTDNEEEYLATAAKYQQEWSAKNKDHLAKYNTTNVNRRLSAIKQQAKNKGYVWELMDEEATTLMTTECFYCGYLELDTTVNGIDRMDNTIGYTKENCVGCCGTCNFMKKALDAHTFIERCRQISFIHGGPGELYDCWFSNKRVSFNEYNKRANKKNIDFSISEIEFNNICSRPCEYCDRRNNNDNINGVDRIDNDIGYTLDNCVSCCGQCNQSKANISYDVYITKCKTIATKSHDIPDMSRCINVVSKRIQKTE
ncbi:hypothetical protein PBCVAN69C_686L [Paramecium bursaria Chlorella virus AN69C]|uniref:Uncharacterized protein n=1 Tax=Paramecium bursaria Chlorella virus IL3A TaxID=46019 RepID=M1I622_PBCVI|nr:hypothetical protein PBCVAN69C_686L [Paramecium bursaria Chlorella virus AN69C]AGE53935.1 hypothetical protein PBCVIL3A_488R [Paramecium bursaria Chlorella virus IL3A]